jgi:hypothetical protein
MLVSTRRAPSLLIPVLAGGLVAGALDILDAWIFFGLRGVSPIV